jgi:hypothetical protein
MNDTRPIVTVCAWCPDKAERDAEASSRGARVSHGICPACREKQLREIHALSFEPVPPVGFVCRSAAPV